MRHPARSKFQRTLRPRPTTWKLMRKSVSNIIAGEQWRVTEKSDTLCVKPIVGARRHWAADRGESRGVIWTSLPFPSPDKMSNLGPSQMSR